MANKNPDTAALARWRAEQPEYARLNITLPLALLERVDAERARPRSQVIAEALEGWLAGRD
jgi:metal-responsive CopG/Arc/MetJ family transcriptional regulator